MTVAVTETCPPLVTAAAREVVEATGELAGPARKRARPVSAAGLESQYWVKLTSRLAMVPSGAVPIWWTVKSPISSLQPRPLPDTLRPGWPVPRNGARTAPV